MAYSTFARPVQSHRRSSCSCSATTEVIVPSRQDHISDSTPMGGTLVSGGATFRTWAPTARAVYVFGDFNGWTRNDDALLVPQGGGRWTGFFPGATDGMTYKFYIVGVGSEGYKRDPYARELTNSWPNPDCILRAANSYSVAGLELAHAVVQRSDRLPVSRWHVLWSGARAETGQVPGRARSNRVPRRPRRERDPAAADRGVQHAAQSRLQRYGSLLSGDGLSGLRERSRKLPAAREPPAPAEGQGAGLEGSC